MAANKKYKLVWPKRVENGVVYKAGAVVDLSHYTDEQIKELIRYGQYIDCAAPGMPPCDDSLAPDKAVK